MHSSSPSSHDVKGGSAAPPNAAHHPDWHLQKRKEKKQHSHRPPSILRPTTISTSASGPLPVSVPVPTPLPLPLALPAPAVPAPVPAPPSKPSLVHLIGRPLVPFFSDDGAENPQLSVSALSHPSTSPPQSQLQSSSHSASLLPWEVNGASNMPVRQFVNGYFVDAGTLGQHAAAAATSDTKPTAAKGKSLRKQQAPSYSHKASPTTSHTHPARRSSSTAPAAPAIPLGSAPSSPSNPATSSSSTFSVSAATTKFAAPAFYNAPSPLKVPLPKFLKQNSNHSTAAQQQQPQQQNSSADLSGNHTHIQHSPSYHQQSQWVLGPSILHLLQPQPNSQSQAQSALHTASLLHTPIPTTIPPTPTTTPTTSPTPASTLTSSHPVTSHPVTSTTTSTTPATPAPASTVSSIQAVSVHNPSPLPPSSSPSLNRLMFLRGDTDNEEDTVVDSHFLHQPP